MATAIAKETNVNVEATQTATADKAASNPIANLWLFFLAIALGGTLLCSAVLMAWPIVANFASKLG